MNADQLALTGELAEELTPERRLLALPPGVHFDVPEDVYHARILGFASKSALDQVLISPAHYYAWVTGARSKGERPAFKLGKAVHCAVLEPARFEREYVLEPTFGDGDMRRTANKDARKAWLAEHADAKVTLRDTEGTAIMGMVRALAGHPTVAALVEGASVETTLRWDVGAVPCKSRLDLYNRELAVAVDLKTTEDARPPAFARTVARLCYDRQDSFYQRGLRAVEQPCESFIFVVVEKEPPHAIGLYTLDEDARTRGHRDNERGIALLEQGIERGEWSCYGEDITTISLPRWALER